MTSAAAIARGSREPDVLDKQYTVLANRYAQPMFAKIVGGHSIDFYSYRVGLPILCGLNYRPRPAVQSYFGCTPALDVLDGNYYFGKGGPDFVLAELEPVDGKLPAMEDRDALLALLSCYKPVAERDGILLYRKYRSVLPGSVAPGVSDTASVVAQMDQWCQAPDLRFPYVAARMSVKPTLLELVGRAVFRPRILYIDVQDESGHVSTHRLGGQNVSRGLLMRPLIGDTSDLLAVGTGHMDRSIQKFRIHYRTMFGNKYTIRNYLSDISITFVGAQSPLDLVGKCRRMSREP